MPRAAASAVPAIPSPALHVAGRHWAIPFALVTLAYFATGLSALLLVIAPGYGSPLYPAAGIALAAVLVYGWRMLGAVGLGALAVDLTENTLRGQRGSASCWSRRWSPPAAIVQAAIGGGVGPALRAASAHADAAARRRRLPGVLRGEQRRRRIALDRSPWCSGP